MTVETFEASLSRSRNPAPNANGDVRGPEEATDCIPPNPLDNVTTVWNISAKGNARDDDVDDVDFWDECHLDSAGDSDYEEPYDEEDDLSKLFEAFYYNADNIVRILSESDSDSKEDIPGAATSGSPRSSGASTPQNPFLTGPYTSVGPSVEIDDEALPVSPTPSFVGVFGYCGCDLCAQNAVHNTVYPPEIRAEKLRLYDEWRAERTRRLEEEVKARQERYATYLILRRRRGMKVVQEMFELGDEEMEDWDRDSYGRWWDTRGREGVERWGTLGFEPSFP